MIGNWGMGSIDGDKPGQALPSVVDALHFTPPLRTPAETMAHDAFSGLLWALSYPGRSFFLPAPLPTTGQRYSPSFQSCVVIGQALLDLETSFFTPDRELTRALLSTGARRVEPVAAAYLFFPQVEQSTTPAALLATLAQASIGSAIYPDQGATIVIACRLGEGESILLLGPGVQTQSEVRVAGLPPGFWQLRAECLHYPQGWDLVLVDGAQVVALPRTTLVRYE